MKGRRTVIGTYKRCPMTVPTLFTPLTRTKTEFAYTVDIVKDGVRQTIALLTNEKK